MLGNPRIRSALVSLLVGAVSLHHMQGQGVATARISGTLTDDSGAVLVGATVQATHLETGSRRFAVTDVAGRFAIADLAIGSYDVMPSSPNLESVVRSGVVLTVGANPVLDFRLKVASAHENVFVNALAPGVETQTGSVSSLVTSEQLHDLPLNGRNFASLISVAPGVSLVPSSLGRTTTGVANNPVYGNQDNYSVSGSRPVGTAILLDNTDISGFFNHGTGSGVTGMALGVDAIAEFQILTNTYGAQFGGTGAVLNIASRSGTNTFHGSAYEFLRNDVLDSRGYFDVDPNGKPTSAPPYRRNQFGGTFGGPIRKNKLFFFVNYEGLRSSLGQTNIAYVPEPYVLGGQVCAVNPQSQSPGATTCPSSDLVRVVSAVPSIQAAILSLYPRPTPAAPDLGGYAPFPEAASLITHQNYSLGRLDYSISSRDSLFGRYVIDRAGQTNPFAGSNIPLWPDREVTRNLYLTAEEKHVFGTGAVSLFRVSFVRNHSNGITTNEVPALSLFPSPGRQNTSVTPGGGLSTVGANGADPFKTVQNKISIGDDLLWTWGAHRLTAGVSAARIESGIVDGNYQSGNFTFFTLSNFLLGEADLYYGGQPPSQGFNDARGFRQIDFFPYLQDDWKVLPKLTLNLGLRWGFSTNPVGSGTPLEAPLNPLTDSGYTVTRHALAQNPNWWNLDPRIGLAYDPFADHKTSIRAGFGIFHEPVEARTYALGYDTGPPSGFILDFPPAGGIPFPAIPNTLLNQQLGVSYRRTVHAPYMIQYNLTVQRELFARAVVSLGYVGSRGVHLFSIVNENPPVPCSLARGPLPSWCPATPSGIPGSASNPFTGVLTNPSFGGLLDAAPTSTSRYNSFQASINRQFGMLQVQASYSWSKCIDIGSASGPQEGSFGVTNPYDQSLDRGPCAFNRSENVAANALYSLPFRRNRFVSGWRLAGLVTGASGLPVNVIDGFNQDLSGLGISRPNYSGAPGCHPYQILNKPIPGPAIQYFNPGCYTLQALGTEGNVGRNSIYGPGLVNIDFSILKRTKINEMLDSEFRAEFFNLLNRANFGQPNANIFAAPTAGQITTLATPPRQIQFVLKLIF